MTKTKREPIDEMIDTHVWLAKQAKKACEAQSSEQATTGCPFSKAKIPIQRGENVVDDE